MTAECSPAPIRTVREARLERIKELERQLAELKQAEERERAHIRACIVEWFAGDGGEDELTNIGETAVGAILDDIPGLLQALRKAGVL